MIFIKSLALIIPTIMILFAVVYIHLIMIASIIRVLLALNSCRTDKETPCLAKIKSAFIKDFFLTKRKIKNMSLLAIGFGVFFLFNFGLFVKYYTNNSSDDRAYHDAKVYYDVGQIPHYYSVTLASYKTPLYPLFLGLNIPATKIKEYLFNQGSKLIPDSDGERELWEYQWFYYPYSIKGSGMWGEYIKDDLPTDNYGGERVYTYSKMKLERIYEILKAINTKSFLDKTKQYEAKIWTYIMARYYYLEGVSLTPYQEYINNPKKSSYLYLAKNPKLIKRDRNIEQWLETSLQELPNEKLFKEYKKEDIKDALMIEGYIESTLLLYIENNIFIDTFKNKFSCDSDRIKRYKELRKLFIDESALTELLSLNHQGAWYGIYRRSVNNIQSEFIRQLLNKECHIDLPGYAREIPFASYVMDINRSIYKEVLYAVNKTKSEKNVKKQPNKATQVYKGDEIVVIEGLEYQNQPMKNMSWFDAKEYCKQLDLNGIGWRLPNIDELQKISNVKMYGKKENQPENWFKENYPKNVINTKNWQGFLKKEFVPNAKYPTWIWTSEVMRHPKYSEYAFYCDFTYIGATLGLRKNKDEFQTLCVRAKKIKIK